MFLLPLLAGCALQPPPSDAPAAPSRARVAAEDESPPPNAGNHP